MPIIAAGLFLVLGISLIFSRKKTPALRTDAGMAHETVKETTLEQIARNANQLSHLGPQGMQDLVVGLKQLDDRQRTWVVARAIELGADRSNLNMANLEASQHGR